MSARNMAKRTAAGTLALAVCLGGGAIALASAASADANFKFDTRIAGDDRYQTAIAASKAAFPEDGKTANVILVNGYATVDGLTASYLAGVANAPILYVSESGADAATKAEIKRLGAKNIWLVGGEKVIPASVETAIKGDGYNVTRINGSDRYETAKLIAEAGTKIAGKKPAKVFVASGTSFADALAVSPIAFNKGYAIALTEKDSTSQFTKDELGAIGTDNKILVGGEAVVSKKVQADLSIKDEQRVAGADRAVTANLVSDWAKKSEGFNPANAILVGGTNGNGPDSLVAASLGGKSFSTLHFAGWDATNVYFKDHSAELTGKGFVFGGKAAVSEGDVSKAQSAAQTVAVAVGYLVTDVTAVASGSFKYADPAAKAAVKVSLASTDKYMVNGVAATQGAFAAALSVGDVVSVSGTKGAMVYSLTNKAAADYTKGMISAVNTASSGSGAHTLNIGDPVTGTSLSGAIDYAGSFTVFTVDGATVSQAIFESSVQLGDMVAISGTGADASHIRTIALTNASVTGVISSVTGSAGAKTVTVKSDAGAPLAFLQAAGDTYKLDGAASTQALVEGAMTAGDTITISRSGGVATYAVVNSAPSSISGVVNGASSSTDLKYWSAAGVEKTVTYSSAMVSGTYIVDGKVASASEFLAAVTPGDQVTFQAADTATSTTASLSLTSKPLSGKVTASSSTQIEVSSADGDVLKTALNYTSATSLFSAGTSVVYSVDGVTKSQSQFVNSVSGITSGALQGTVTVSFADGVVTYALATTAWTATPAIASANNGSSSATVITVNLNKPVTVTGAAAGDFTVTVGGTPVTPASAPTVSGSVVTITLPASSMSANASVVVTPTTTGAAKYVDAYGTGLATAGITFSAS